MTRSKPLVLRFVSRMAVGGVQNGIIETLSVADRESFDFAVMCYKKAGKWAPRIEELGINVHARKTLPVWHPYQLMRLSRAIRRIAPDLVYVYQSPSIIPGVTAARLAGVRRIVVHYTSINEPQWAAQSALLNRWEKRLTLRADAIVAVSEAVAERSARWLGIDPSRITVIRNGVNFSKWSEAPTLDLRAELGLKPETPLVGHVARYHELKRIEDLIEAAVIVGREGLTPPGRPAPVFLVIGGGPKSLAAQYQKLAAEAAPWADVRLIGERADLPSVLPNLDVGILCSEIEGCPNTILEYMCAGVPIAATNIKSIADIVGHESEALLSAPRDPAGLARSIGRLLNDPELARTLALRARSKAEDYRWERTEAEYERVYRRVLGLA